MLNKASVIIPIYNGLRWADSIIESISTNLEEIGEVILINDGDKDDFEILLAKLKNKIKVSIRCFHTLGLQGPAIGRNLGLDHATYDYITFLDCDDIWLPASLKKRIELLNCNPQVPFVYSSFQYISELGLPLNKYYVPTVADLSQLLVTNYIALPSVVLRKKALGEMRFPCVGHEDYALWLALLRRHGRRAVGTSESGLLVRVFSKSLSANKAKAFQWHWTILHKFGVPRVMRECLFIGYAINAVLKRHFGCSRPIFFGLHHLTQLWLARRPPE